ncbi:MAG: hypothetical protein ACT4QG_12465 [Sporichthyaceae bacterium]
MRVRSIDRSTAVACGAVAVVALALTPVVADDARAGTGTTCTGRILTGVDPGIFVQTRSGTYANSAPGTIECDGPVYGKMPTGPGVWLEDSGTYEGNCLRGGIGTSVVKFRIPTSDGPLEFGDESSPFTWGPLKADGVFGGEMHDGAKLIRDHSVLPAKGDCAISPVTELDVTLTMTFKAGSGG